MERLEYLLTKCKLELNYPNCPGLGDCDNCWMKGCIEYEIEKYKTRIKNNFKRNFIIIKY